MQRTMVGISFHSIVDLLPVFGEFNSGKKGNEAVFRCSVICKIDEPRQTIGQFLFYYFFNFSLIELNRKYDQRRNIIYTSNNSRIVYSL